jgi:hypothetical protein
VKTFAPLLLLLCACGHAGLRPQHAFFVGQADDGASTAGGMMAAGWGESTPRAAEDQDVDHYFVRDGDGAWIIAVGLVTEDDGKTPQQSLSAALNQLAARATRFDGSPTPAQVSVQPAKGPTGLTRAAEPAAEAEFEVAGPPLLHAYAAVIQLGRRHVFILTGSSKGAPPVAEARGLARRIRF